MDNPRNGQNQTTTHLLDSFSTFRYFWILLHFLWNTVVFFNVFHQLLGIPASSSQSNRTVLGEPLAPGHRWGFLSGCGAAAAKTWYGDADPNSGTVLVCRAATSTDVFSCYKRVVFLLVGKEWRNMKINVIKMNECDKWMLQKKHPGVWTVAFCLFVEQHWAVNFCETTPASGMELIHLRDINDVRCGFANMNSGGGKYGCGRLFFLFWTLWFWNVLDAFYGMHKEHVDRGFNGAHLMTQSHSSRAIEPIDCLPIWDLWCSLCNSCDHVIHKMIHNILWESQHHII